MQVVFEGVTDYGYQGDIALDDITLKPGNCPKPGRLLIFKKNLTTVYLLCTKLY